MLISCSTSSKSHRSLPFVIEIHLINAIHDYVSDLLLASPTFASIHMHSSEDVLSPLVSALYVCHPPGFWDLLYVYCYAFGSVYHCLIFLLLCFCLRLLLSWSHTLKCPLLCLLPLFATATTLHTLICLLLCFCFYMLLLYMPNIMSLPLFAIAMTPNMFWIPYLPAAMSPFMFSTSAYHCHGHSYIFCPICPLINYLDLYRMERLLEQVLSAHSKLSYHWIEETGKVLLHLSLKSFIFVASPFYF